MGPFLFNAFRYGLVLLYLGTLFVVIGYHNAWVGFVKYIGLGMVILGTILVGSATTQSCAKLAHRQVNSKWVKMGTKFTPVC